MNQRYRRFIQRYMERLDQTGIRTLLDEYKKPSKAKIAAWDNILNDCNELKGFGLTIIGSNAFMFNAAFTYKDKSGYKLMLYTPSAKVSLDLTEVAAQAICTNCCISYEVG